MALKTFLPSDFEIRRLVGKQSLLRIVEWEYYQKKNPTEPAVTVEPGSLACRLYEAILYPNTKQETEVLLKEYHKEALEMGYNEKSVFETLEEDYGVDITSEQLPLSRFLGSLEAPDTFETEYFREQWQRALPYIEPPKAGHLFLVFCWEGLSTVASYPVNRNNRAWLSTIFLESKFQRRCQFVKKIMSSSLEALEFLHRYRIVHLSLGPQSLLLNTTREDQVHALKVRLRDFGFSRRLSSLDDDSIRRAYAAGASNPRAISNYYYAQDIVLLGYVFLMLTFCSFADSVIYQKMGYDGLKRLVEDLFQFDFDRLRSYLIQDDSVRDVVRFLDQGNGSGWVFARNMLILKRQLRHEQDELIATELKNSSFLLK
ncbi:ATP binding / protein kinase [Galdieria sulphuraria]|uniref:ATP binding / protein kinase n=1 Tax=Galdieria sulphuraria TaxID=130081 RepID=M2Y960_GALSU|nr:ATP binding / protein kinase [Galdieria sulphuraria]EME32374.1 ATP binding / protein kinase [Galdieria sulphuraria]|eukprot:XP_005708894.1 ATP binding / protein kinase [Galdieria sulphuraria]